MGAPVGEGAAVFIDAIMVKVRDGQVRNKPVYAAIGVDLAGHKDILGMWAGDGDGGHRSHSRPPPAIQPEAA